MYKELQENNYIYLPNFISESQAKVLANNYKSYCKKYKCTGDDQAINSEAEYNYIEFLDLLCTGIPTLSDFLGEKLLPTYTYARVYKNGNILTRHRDRDACEVSLTLHLDGDKDWPIFIQKPNGEEISLNLKSGDAMLYLGCDADHWREEYKGDEYVQVFLHYVRLYGPKNYAYFDKVRTRPHVEYDYLDRLEPPKKMEMPEQTKVKPVEEKTELRDTKSSMIDFSSKDFSSKKQISNLTLRETKNDATTDEMFPPNLKDYILVFENVVPDALCDRIINEYSSTDLWQYATIGDGQLNKEMRNVTQVGISEKFIIDKNYNERRDIDNELFSCASTAIKLYNTKFPLSQIHNDSGYILLRYPEGHYYKQHTDSYIINPRHVSCSFALNDDFEGGEFAFFNRKYSYSLKKGSVIMFPSNFMFPHEITPVTKGTRFSIITWFL